MTISKLHVSMATRMLGIAALAMTVWTTGASAQLANGNFSSFTTAPNGSWSELQVTGGSPSVTPTLSNWNLTQGPGNTGTGISCVTGATIVGYGSNVVGAGNPGATAICGTSYTGPTSNPNGGSETPSYATLWSSPGTIPGGYSGKVIIADANATYHQNITQAISGLVNGAQYTLSFYQAAGQQTGYTGGWTDNWLVTWNGNPGVTGTLMPVASEGVVPWELQTMTFTAGATNTLTFLAQSNDLNSNEPPMVLLANVSLTRISTPEPASLALLGVGLTGLTYLRRKRARRIT